MDKEKFEQLFTDVREIKNALLGDEFNDKGIIKRLECVENTISEYRTYKQRVIGAMIAINGFWGLLLTIIGLYKKFF
jgi:hypothetical protein